MCGQLVNTAPQNRIQRETMRVHCKIIINCISCITKLKEIKEYENKTQTKLTKESFTRDENSTFN